MNSWEEFALITFIACDVLVERPRNIKLICDAYYTNLVFETKDIIKRLFK